MVKAKKRNRKLREIQWIKSELWPHEYAQQIIDGKTTLDAVPEHYRDLTVKFLEIAQQAEERQCVKTAARIAQLPSLWSRRIALLRVPEHLRLRVKKHAEQIYKQICLKARKCYEGK